MLKKYPQAAFWGARGYFLTKCASLKTAMKKKRTYRRRIFGGACSNGKGRDYVLGKSPLWKYAKPTDGVNHTNVDTFRLDGSKMHDAIELRAKEYPNRKILGAIFKKWRRANQ